MKRKKRSTSGASAAKPDSKLEAVATAAEQSFVHNDSRVILRRRDVLMFELATTDEHLIGLRASLTEVLARKAQLEAKVKGLNRALGRRAC